MGASASRHRRGLRTNRPLSLVTSVFVALVLEGAAAACAVCSSGSPAAAAPSKGPVTLLLDARAGAARVNRWQLDERRLEITGSYDFSVFSEPFGVDAGLPVLWRTVSGGERAAELVSLGDMETRLRYLAWRSRWVSLSLFLGTKWPTAPVATIHGVTLPSALQPGCSSVAPFAGASVVRTADEWTFSGIGQILLPFSVREAPHPGDSIRLSGSVERRLTSWLATRTALSVRLETGGFLAADVPDPDSGGAVLYVATEAVLRPSERVTAAVGLTFPVIQGWFGARRESPVAAISITASP